MQISCGLLSKNFHCGAEAIVTGRKNVLIPSSLYINEASLKKLVSFVPAKK